MSEGTPEPPAQRVDIDALLAEIEKDHDAGAERERLWQEFVAKKTAEWEEYVAQKDSKKIQE